MRLWNFLKAAERLIEFSSKTQHFDEKNNTITRVFVKDLTLPVINNEYYADLFSFLKKKGGRFDYNGVAGNLLDKCAGVFIVVNANSEKNVQSLYRSIKTYVEEINGSRII